jgi:hypothetical protein
MVMQDDDVYERDLFKLYCAGKFRSCGNDPCYQPEQDGERCKCGQIRNRNADAEVFESYRQRMKGEFERCMNKAVMIALTEFKYQKDQ